MLAAFAAACCAANGVPLRDPLARRQSAGLRILRAEVQAGSGRGRGRDFDPRGLHVKVPLLDVKAQNAPLREAIMTAIARVVDGGAFILGPEVEAFEKELAAVLGTRRAVGLSSGTDALLVALMALDVRPGDEVVTTPYSFFATVGCIARLGAQPVFADIDPQTFNLDPAAA